MSKKNKNDKDKKTARDKEPEIVEMRPEPEAEPQPAPEAKPETKPEAEAEVKPEAKAEPSQAEQLQKKLEAEHDQYLRLAAEFDNFRKRSRKEKEELYTDIKAQTVEKFLPVYDNLERALANETADEAYKKGVELTMNELRKIMKGLGVEEFGEAGETFDPTAHNAVMHIEDDTLDENTVAQVFQRGFRIGEKVVRFAVVKVAN